MFLQIEILDGSMRGEQFSFDLIEGQEVRIGRDSEACEVALTEDYVRCCVAKLLKAEVSQTLKESPNYCTYQKIRRLAHLGCQ